MAISNTVKPTGLFAGLSVSPSGGLLTAPKISLPSQGSSYSPSFGVSGTTTSSFASPQNLQTNKPLIPAATNGLLSNGSSSNTATANYNGQQGTFNGNTFTPNTPQNTPQAPVNQSGVTPNGTVIGANGQSTNQQVTYPGLVSGLVNSSINGNQNVGGLVSNLSNTSSAGSAAGQAAQQATQQASQGAYNTGSAQEQQAFNNAEQLRQQLLQSQLNEASTIANNNSQPIPLEFQQGRNQIAQSQYAAQQAGYGSALQGESNLANIGLGSQGQGITGLGTAGNLANTAQSNTITGLSNAASQANTAQSNLQSGISNAAGYAAPILGNYGQANYGIGGNAAGGGNLDPQTQATSLAQKVMSGQMTYDQAVQSLGYAGNVGTNFLNNAITGAGGNLISLQAQGAATQSNIQTGGTAATGAAAQGLQQSTQAYVAANTAYTTAQQQAGNLQQTMASTGINSNPQFVNQKINALQNQLGSANYASFITSLNEARQAYTNLLSSVGASTPTVNGQQATDIFNANSTPSQINAAIQALNQAAYAKLKPMYDQISTYQSQLSNNSGSSSQGGNVGMFGSFFVGN